jgi:DNA repair protein RecN (Recombination protein N)
MDELIQIDPKLAKFDNQLKDAFYEIEDFVENIREYKDSVEYDSERLIIVEDRMSKIRILQKKYGKSINEILEYCETSKETLIRYENWNDEKKKLEQNIVKLQAELVENAKTLSEKRNTAASVLQKKIELELGKLGMNKVKFRVLVRKKKDDEIKKYGMDNIEFVISTNPGEPFKRLRKIASGGELSRVMLAVKSILAESDNINVLIFDEVDAGIGGEVALAVGNKLKKLSTIKQIFCITHLATIAVYADNHFKVEKNIKDGRTLTQVERIKGNAVTKEISRMLSGDINNETALKHADELLKKYRSFKT